MIMFSAGWGGVLLEEKGSKWTHKRVKEMSKIKIIKNKETQTLWRIK